MERETIVIKTKECSTCFFCSSAFDSFDGVEEAWTHTCNIMYSRFLDEFGAKRKSNIEFMMEKDEYGSPIHPNWCPLFTNKILIKWETK